MREELGTPLRLQHLWSHVENGGIKKGGLAGVIVDLAKQFVFVSKKINNREVILEPSKKLLVF